MSGSDLITKLHLSDTLLDSPALSEGLNYLARFDTEPLSSVTINHYPDRRRNYGERIVSIFGNFKPPNVRGKTLATQKCRIVVNIAGTPEDFPKKLHKSYERRPRPEYRYDFDGCLLWVMIHEFSHYLHYTGQMKGDYRNELLMDAAAFQYVREFNERMGR